MRGLIATNPPKRGSALLSLRTWARAHSWIMRLYRCLPETWRERVAQRHLEQMISSFRFPDLPATGAHVELKAPIANRNLGGGVNLFGYFRGQFGLAEAARLYASALMDAGYPVALNDVNIDLPHGFDDHSFGAHLDKGAPYPINLIFVNPDYFEAAIAKLGRDRTQGRHVIACWFWELECVPKEWLPIIDQVDEIMVSSRFIEQAFRRVTNKRITRVPLPLVQKADSGIGRAEFGLDAGDFIFLTNFDFHSWIQRKNPFATIEAFRVAFPDPSLRVKLLIKTSNGQRHPDAFFELLSLSKSDSRIVVRDGILDRSHLRALQRCCDVCVSLHRAEGFGLGLAECMELGKPVVSTAWSGNLDFMSEENSCLVPFRLVSVGPNDYLHGHGEQWADADTAQAAAYMRRLFEDRQFAAEIGRRAAIDVASRLSPVEAVQPLIRRLDELSVRITKSVAAVRPGGGT